MRKSMEGIEFMFKKAEWPGLPEELQELSYFVQDQGYCLMIIPACFEAEAWAGNPDGYEMPVPIRYALEKGYRLRDGYAVVDVPYDRNIGADIPDEYYCWDLKDI